MKRIRRSHRRLARPGHALAAALAAALATGTACGPSERPEASAEAQLRESAEEAARSPYSVDAKLDTIAVLQEDLAAAVHPADGAGRGVITAWWRLPREPGETPRRIALDVASGERPKLRVGDRARFELRFEAGPLGIARDGVLFLQPSPFWGWETPQGEDPMRPAYTEARLEASGLPLETRVIGEQLMAIALPNGLAPGAAVTLSYGSGARMAGIDRYAESGAVLWFAVDGDADGVRRVVEDSPRVDIEAGPAALLSLRGPSTGEVGDTLHFRLSALDLRGSVGTGYRGRVALRSQPAGLQLPESVALAPDSRSSASFEAVVEREGIFRIEARAEPGELGALEAVSNPLVVGRDGGPQLWADFHGHSQLSDGTGTPEDYFRYAHEVAGLDVVALTDHDHWGMQFLDARPALWKHIRDTTARHHEPGVFVTVLGYEWTSWLHGHRHVLHFAENGPLLSSLDPDYETPAQLWAGLRGLPALTFAHHSAGGPVSTNWRYPPDPVLEPVTEVASVHGNSEALDGPAPIYAPVPGNFLRDALNAGYRFGFIGSGDSHDGHPGLTHLGTGSREPLGGLAALLTGDRTREGVLAAMRARRVYATNGARIWLRVTLDGQPMGSTLVANESQAEGASLTLRIDAAAEAPIERIDLVRSGHLARIDGDGGRAVSITREIPALAPGEYHYVRVVQNDGGAAWSSPIFASPVAPPPDR